MLLLSDAVISSLAVDAIVKVRVMKLPLLSGYCYLYSCCWCCWPLCCWCCWCCWCLSDSFYKNAIALRVRTETSIGSDAKFFTIVCDRSNHLASKSVFKAEEVSWVKWPIQKNMENLSLLLKTVHPVIIRRTDPEGWFGSQKKISFMPNHSDLQQKNLSVDGNAMKWDFQFNPSKNWQLRQRVA